MREDVVLTVGGTRHIIGKEFGIRLTGFNITPPAVKESYIDIPFSDVSYDVTEYFGKPTYNRRSITLSFGFPKPLPCWEKVVDEFVNLFHGQAVKISLVSSSEWEYSGRCSVDTGDKASYHDAAIVVTINALPKKVNKRGVERL